MHPTPIATWLRIVAANDAGALDALLAEDAVFSSPAVHAPQRGKSTVAKYLRAAMVILKNPSFRYVHEWYADRSAVLEFEVTIGGVFINGVDLVSWDDNDRIVSFKVMIRPMKALNKVVELMGAQLQVPEAATPRSGEGG